MEACARITVTRNAINSSARVEINVARQSPPLAYRVTRDPDGNRFIIRDPFGAAIEGVPTLDRAIEMATGLAENVRDWAGGQGFDC